MNISPRRAPVIAWAITAATLYGGVGIGFSAPAGADGGGTGSATGAQADGSGTDDPSNTGGPRRHGRLAESSSGGASSGPSSSDSGEGHFPCPWWPPRPVPPPAPFVPAFVGGGNGGGFIAPVITHAAPIPVFGDRVTPAPDAGAVRLPDLSGLSVPAPAATAPLAPVPPAARAGLPRPAPRVAPTAPVLPAAVPVPPAAVTGPTAPAPMPQRAGLGPEPTTPERLGYPDALRDAGLTTLISTALPGLAAMAGMTALGGVLGYRQARAGYLLRATGAGRFLQ